MIDNEIRSRLMVSIYYHCRVQKQKCRLLILDFLKTCKSTVESKISNNECKYHYQAALRNAISILSWGYKVTGNIS